MQEAWAGQVTNVTASATNGGMTLSGTQTNNGQPLINYFLPTSTINDFISKYIDGDVGGEQGGGEESNGLETAKTVTSIIGLTADVQATTWTGAKLLLKENAGLLKPFTGPATAIGAVIGIGSAIYDMKTNPNANYVKDWFQIGLGVVVGASEAFGIGEVWDWIGVGVGVTSTAMDIHDIIEDHNKKD